MDIDPKIEESLRYSLAAVVNKDPDGVLGALEALDVPQRRYATGYAVLAIGYVMHDVYEEDADAEAAEVMAERITPRITEWFDIDLTQQEAAAYLTACVTGDDQFAGVDPENLMVHGLLICGELLAHFRPQELRWFEYLDRIWDHVLSLPDPAP